jgi:hypothetical protein
MPARSASGVMQTMSILRPSNLGFAVFIMLLATAQTRRCVLALSASAPTTKLLAKDSALAIGPGHTMQNATS